MQPAEISLLSTITESDTPPNVTGYQKNRYHTSNRPSSNEDIAPCRVVIKIIFVVVGVELVHFDPDDRKVGGVAPEKSVVISAFRVRSVTVADGEDRTNRDEDCRQGYDDGEDNFYGAHGGDGLFLFLRRK